MEKVIKNGNVAVLISSGFGAGWSTWNSGNTARTILFHSKIVKMVEEGRRSELTESWVRENCNINDDYICVLGADQLEVVWLQEGTRFIIEEYDGSESVRTTDDLSYNA